MEKHFFTIPGTSVQASVSNVETTTDLFNVTDNIRAKELPTNKGHFYIPFGSNNQAPYELQEKILSDEVTAENKFFNILTCYGQGLNYQPKEGAELSKEEEEFVMEQNFPKLLLEQITDLKYFFFSVVCIILSKDGKRILQIKHKEAAFCRLSQADNRGVIPYVYYANWKEKTPVKVEIIPLLDETAPLSDLRKRISKGEKGRKFAVLMRFPTVGNSYYPTPYYTSIFKSGIYDEKRIIATGRRTKLKNTTTAKYQIEIHRDYWADIFTRERITEPHLQQERIQKEMEQIKNFMAGIENAGKVWISGCYTTPDGKEQRLVRIHNIEGQKEGGEWMEDVQATTNAICYADCVHPNLVGAVPGKSQSNNSGSDKRELFTLKQSLEKAFKDLILLPHKLIIHYNNFNCTPQIPMLLLTTLDKHQDAILKND